MKRRYPLIVGGALLAVLILGSFFDLQLAQTLYIKNNPFSLIFAILGEYLTFGGLAFFGGLIVKTSFKQLKNKVWATLFFIGGLIYLIVGGFIFGHELSETDALGGVSSIFEKIYIYAPLGIVLIVPMFLLGLKLSSKVINTKQYASLVALSFAILFAIVVTIGIKELACRPRFFYLEEVRQDYLIYRDWWVIFDQKESFMQLDGVDSNAFKSLPSGHACYSMAGLMVAASFPILDEKYNKLLVPCFFGVICFSFIVSFSRLLCGRHYLSDVAVGMLIGLVSYFLINEIIKNFINKKLEVKE